MNVDLENILKAATATVFSTMLNTTPEFGPFESDCTTGEEQVAGTVGFTGSLNGIIHFCSSASFARRLTCRMLSMEESEIEGNEMINDVIGELTNMLAGQIKHRMQQAGTHCLLTVPSVMRGSNVKSASSSHSVRKSVYFKCHGGHAVIEAAIKT
jgi:chemotaxis protein CheX